MCGPVVQEVQCPYLCPTYPDPASPTHWLLFVCSYPFSGHHIGTLAPHSSPFAFPALYPTPRAFTTGSSGDAAAVAIRLSSRVSSNTGPPTCNGPHRWLDPVLTGIPRWSYCLHPLSPSPLVLPSPHCARPALPVDNIWWKWSF